jgi:hypothetical protein
MNYNMIGDHFYVFSRLLHTCYMGTENSSNETRLAAKELASMIGS